MKHAFLIIAHNNWDQLQKLMSAYDSEKCDFYIHINSMIRINGELIDSLKHVTKKSNVVITERIPITWGKVGILKASFILLKEAFNRKYDYYHLLTGADLPLVNIESFDKFFCEHLFDNKSNGKFKTNYVSVSIPNSKIASRVEHYNFFVELWRNQNKYIRKMATSSSTLFCLFQRFIGINRIKHTGWRLYTGSSWWSISNDFAKYYLSLSEILIKQFQFMTFAADEFAIQTVIKNSNFNDSLYISKSEQASNLRLLDFTRGNGYGSPHVYTIEDIEEINGTLNLIGRKFDEKVDEKITNYIIKKISK